jgi:hypothetical protein
LVQYVASCYPGQRYQPTREFRRPNIPGRQQDRLAAHHEHGRSRTLDTVVTYQGHQRQHAVHSCLASGDGAHDQPGTGGRPWQNVTVIVTWYLHSLFHPRMTFRLCLRHEYVVNTRFQANFQRYTFSTLRGSSVRKTCHTFAPRCVPYSIVKMYLQRGQE